MNKKYYQVQYIYTDTTEWDEAYWLSDVNDIPYEFDTYGDALREMQSFVDRMDKIIDHKFCYRMVYFTVKAQPMSEFYPKVAQT